jgi:WD40 repeat protein
VAFAGDLLLAGTTPLREPKGGLAAYGLRGEGRKRWILRTSDDGNRRFDTSSIIPARDGRTAFVGTVSSTSSVYFNAAVARVDLATGELLWRVDGPPYTQVSSIALSADGTTVAAGTGVGTAWTLDAETGAVRTTLPGQPVAVRGLAFRAGEAPLVSSSSDGQLRTWADRSTEKVLRRLPGGREAAPETFLGSPFLQNTADGHLVIDPATGETARRIARLPVDDGLVFSPNGRSYATFADFVSDSEVTIRDVESGRERQVLRLGERGSADANVFAAPANDGRLAVVRYPRGSLEARGQVVSADGTSTVELQPFEIRCDAFAFFSPDGSMLASLDTCGAVTFHDTATGRVIRQVRVDDRNQYLVWTADGRVVTDGSRGTVHVVDPDKPTARALRESEDSIDDVETSPDGRWLAAMGADNVVSVWDARTLRLVRQHVLRTRPNNIAFSRDSDALGVIDAGGLVHVWDVCDICRNAEALLEQTRKNSSRRLTATERETYGVNP